MFQDVQEKKWESQYKDWFNVSFDGNSNYNDGFWYEGWEGLYNLVKLNLRNDNVVNYLLGCIRSWIDEFDIDGLRLDVAYLLDHNFMRRLRAFTGELKEDFFLLGEMLHGDYNIIVNNTSIRQTLTYKNKCMMCSKKFDHEYIGRHSGKPIIDGKVCDKCNQKVIKKRRENANT